MEFMRLRYTFRLASGPGATTLAHRRGTAQLAATKTQQSSTHAPTSATLIMHRETRLTVQEHQLQLCVYTATMQRYAMQLASAGTSDPQYAAPTLAQVVPQNAAMHCPHAETSHSTLHHDGCSTQNLSAS